MSNERDDVLPRDDADGEDTMLTMDQLMAQYEAAEPLQDLREGDLVEGVVVQIDDQSAMIDIGTKSEGVIQRGELDSIRDSIAVGQTIQVVVVRIEEEGNLIVSKRQADAERAWEDIVKMADSGEMLEAPVVEAVKGGLLVDLGIYGQGFVPASHVSIRRPRNLARYIGQTLKLQVIEVERKRKRVVLSHRKVVEGERAAEREDTLKTLREGQVRRGVVRRITDFGAFVDIGGVDGLLHISEMSWQRVDDPGELLRVGDDAEVMVLKTNKDENRISLGLRQLQSDPWREIPKRYREGERLKVRVTRTLPDGVLVRLPVGLDTYLEIPEELRPAAPAAPADEAADAVAEVTADDAVAEAPVVEEAVAEAPVGEAPAAAAPAVDAGAGDVVAEAPAEAATDEAVAEAPAAVDEAVAEAPAEAADEAAAAAPAAADEAAAEAPADPFAVGCELDVRIDRIIAVEREIHLVLASQQPAAERRYDTAGEDRPRSAGGRVPAARGRYSDRVRGEDEDDDRGESRSQPSPRRERRRDRDRDDDREREFTVSDVATPPARRTLGDLMGDKLRALFQEEPSTPEANQGAAEVDEESTEEAPNGAAK